MTFYKKLSLMLPRILLLRRSRGALWLLSVLVSLSCSPFSGSFEGKVYYKPSIEGEGKEQIEPLLKMQDLSFSLYHKGDKVRIDRLRESMIVDYAKDSFYVLQPELKEYVALPLHRGKEDTLLPVVQALTEKRTILGHTCMGKRVEMPQDTQIFWEATDITVPAAARKAYPIVFRGAEVQGLPLRIEYTLPTLPLRLIYEATEIEEENLQDTLFQIPPSYKRISQNL